MAGEISRGKAAAHALNRGIRWGGQRDVLAERGEDAARRGHRDRTTRPGSAACPAPAGEAVAGSGAGGQRDVRAAGVAGAAARGAVDAAGRGRDGAGAGCRNAQDVVDDVLAERGEDAARRGHRDRTTRPGSAACPAPAGEAVAGSGAGGQRDVRAAGVAGAAARGAVDAAGRGRDRTRAGIAHGQRVAAGAVLAEARSDGDSVPARDRERAGGGRAAARSAPAGEAVAGSGAGGQSDRRASGVMGAAARAAIDTGWRGCDGARAGLANAQRRRMRVGGSKRRSADQQGSQNETHSAAQTCRKRQRT